MRYSQKYIDHMKKEIPHIAFKLFAERGIESVSMQNIADACNYGVATLYRYYGTKLNLVIQICAEQWNLYAEEAEQSYQQANGEQFTAYQEMEFFLDTYIHLYKHHKDLLKFNSNFDLFVMQEKASVEEMKPYYEALQFYKDRFHEGYMKAFQDHTIRTDIPERSVYFGFMYAILSAASKFAYGTVYPYDIKLDYSYGLEMEKQSFLSYMTRFPE